MDDELAGLLGRLRELIEEATTPDGRPIESTTSETRTSESDESADSTQSN